MCTPPRRLDGADVLYFTPIDDRHTPTGGCRHIDAGVPGAPAQCLAICRYEDAEGFYLFGCDDGWNVVTDTFHETVEDAMRQAEFEYEGASRTWRSHP